MHESDRAKEVHQLAWKAQLSNGFFQWAIVIGLWWGVFVLALGVQNINQRLEQILDEMTGEALRKRNELDFWAGGKEQK